MYETLLDIHSVLRYVIVLLVLWIIIRSASGRMGKMIYKPSDKRMSTFATIFIDIQLLIGLLLLFVYSPLEENFHHGAKTIMKNDATRYWIIEHPVGMLIAIAFFHIGSSKAKKGLTDKDKFNKTFWFFLIGFIIMMVTIPWPFLPQGRAWFPQ